MISQRIKRFAALGSLVFLAIPVFAQEGIIFSNISARDTGQGNVIVTWETAAYAKARVLYDTASRGIVRDYAFSTNGSRENARLHAELISGISKGTYYVRPVARIGDVEFFGEELKVVLSSEPLSVATVSSKESESSVSVIKPVPKEENITEEGKTSVPVLRADGSLPAPTPIIVLDEDDEEALQTTFVSKKMYGDSNGVVGPIFALTQEIWSLFSVSMVLVICVLGFIAILVLRRN